MNLFEKLKTSMSTPSLSNKKGRFVVDDSIGISLLAALNYYENKGSYILVTSNLYKAQSIYSKICSFVPQKDVLLFPADELIRAETLAPHFDNSSSDNMMSEAGKIVTFCAFLIEICVEISKNLIDSTSSSKNSIRIGLS